MENHSSSLTNQINSVCKTRKTFPMHRCQSSDEVMWDAWPFLSGGIKSVLVGWLEGVDVVEHDDP